MKTITSGCFYKGWFCTKGRQGWTAAKGDRRLGASVANRCMNGSYTLKQQIDNLEDDTVINAYPAAR